ncbi:MAG: hypothetical protein GY759_18880 [Chloroflexi bacterium]|nr:hypothetical protein [Chloroflexota bacterium]
MKRISSIKKYLNWRIILVRILVNALVLGITVLILPNIRFVSPSIISWFFLALALGVLNAIIKPLVQILTLPFIFTTYGLVLFLINAAMIVLLALLFPGAFAISSLWAALIGGAIMGILSSFLESLLGVSPPILPDENEELRKKVGYQTASLSSIVLQPKTEGLADSGITIPVPNDMQVDLTDRDVGVTEESLLTTEQVEAPVPEAPIAGAQPPDEAGEIEDSDLPERDDDLPPDVKASSALLTDDDIKTDEVNQQQGSPGQPSDPTAQESLKEQVPASGDRMPDSSHPPQNEDPPDPLVQTDRSNEEDEQ